MNSVVKIISAICIILGIGVVLCGIKVGAIRRGCVGGLTVARRGIARARAVDNDDKEF
jgi:hypothetical protein